MFSKANLSLKSNVSQPLSPNSQSGLGFASVVNSFRIIRGRKLSMTDSSDSTDSVNSVVSDNETTENNGKLFTHLGSSTNKSPKEIYTMAKLYHKYLETVHSKLSTQTTTQQLTSTQQSTSTQQPSSTTQMQKDFDEYYINANVLYEEIKKDWFWLSNDQTQLMFCSKNKLTDIEEQKMNLLNNFNMLEIIAKLYGFDVWYDKNKANINRSRSEST